MLLCAVDERWFWMNLLLAAYARTDALSKGIQNYLLSTAFYLFLFTKSVWLSGFPISWVSHRWVGKFAQYVIQWSGMVWNKQGNTWRLRIQVWEQEYKMWSKRVSVLYRGFMRIVCAEGISVSQQRACICQAAVWVSTLPVDFCWKVCMSQTSTPAPRHGNEGDQESQRLQNSNVPWECFLLFVLTARQVW